MSSSKKKKKKVPPEATGNCKFAATSQPTSLTAPLGREPFCGKELRGILRRLRRLRADWISFLILRKAQNCGVDTQRNPVGRTLRVSRSPQLQPRKKPPGWAAFFVVELRGIEPLSESNLTGLSSGEVCYLHSLAEAGTNTLIGLVES